MPFKPCSILLIAASILLGGYKPYVLANPELAQLDFFYNKLISTVHSPLNMVQKKIDLIDLNYQERLSSNKPAKQQLLEDFRWIFKAEGLTFDSPGVDLVNGTIYVATTDINNELNLQDAREPDSRDGLFNIIHSNLYALEPDLIEKTGKGKWVFRDINGVIAFSPIIAADRTILAESINGINIRNSTFENLQGELYSVDQNGKDKWGKQTVFKGEIFLGPPVVSPEGSIIIATIKPFDPLNMNNSLEGLSTTVASIDPADGNIKWSFSPLNLSSDTSLIINAGPVISQTGDLVFINVIRPLSALDIQEEINGFIKGLEDNLLETVDEGKKEDLLEAIEKGEDIEPIIEDIEKEVGLLINDRMDEFLHGLLNSLGKVFALDINDGSVKWEATFSGFSLSSPIIISSDEIHVGAVNLLASVKLEANLNVTVNNPKDPEAGFDITLNIIPPAKDDITITTFGTLNSIDISSGEILWSTNTDEPILVRPVFDQKSEATLVGATSFTIDTTTDKLNISNLKSKIYAINSVDGSIHWASELFEGIVGIPSIDSVFDFPLLPGRDGDVFFTLFDPGKRDDGVFIFTPKIQAINPDGTTRWPAPFVPDGLVTSTPIIKGDDDTLFLSVSNHQGLFNEKTFGIKNSGTENRRPDFNGQLISLNPDNGAVIKSIEMDGFAYSSPVIDANMESVLVATDGFKINRKPFSFGLETLVHSIRIRLGVEWMK